MNSETIAWIIVQALNAGLDMRDIASEVNKSGKVSEDTWDAIAADVKGANDAWEGADIPKG